MRVVPRMSHYVVVLNDTIRYELTVYIVLLSSIYTYPWKVHRKNRLAP